MQELQNIKIAFHTLGCKVNLYETEVMEEKVKSEGAEVVPFSERADIYVINTCSVTNVADRKSRQMLHRAKKENPDAVIVACGCYAQVEDAEKLYATGVDLIVDNDKKSRITELLSDYMHGKRETDISDISEVKRFDSMELQNPSEHTRAYLKIQDGCNQFCTYCIIPYARGRIRSKNPEEVLQEIRVLSENGVREFVFTGIHLSSYGKDLAEPDGLIRILEASAKIPGVERIRLGSLEPRIITEEFCERLSNIPAICPHFHLSLQSGASETLKRMNRHYTPEEYLTGCALLRKYFENPAITTDVIVGFPQETEEEFSESRRFLTEVNFYEMHIFRYSRRRGTPADRMTGQVPEDVKAERSDNLLSLEREMSLSFRKQYLGKTVEVLTEEETEFQGERYLIGYTKEYIRVLVPVSLGVNRVVRGTLSGFATDEIMKLSLE